MLKKLTVMQNITLSNQSLTARFLSKKHLSVKNDYNQRTHYMPTTDLGAPLAKSNAVGLSKVFFLPLRFLPKAKTRSVLFDRLEARSPDR